MSAELLRKAAALMRQRAEAATPGPWWVHSEEPWCGDQQAALDYDAGRITDAEFDEAARPPLSLFYGDVVHTPDAEHIASWHPAVALAVADWLDSVAERAERNIRPDLYVHGWVPALAVARAYLGSAS